MEIVSLNIPAAFWGNFWPNLAANVFGGLVTGLIVGLILWCWSSRQEKKYTERSAKERATREKELFLMSMQTYEIEVTASPSLMHESKNFASSQSRVLLSKVEGKDFSLISKYFSQWRQLPNLISEFQNLFQEFNTKCKAYDTALHSFVRQYNSERGRDPVNDSDDEKYIRSVEFGAEKQNVLRHLGFAKELALQRFDPILESAKRNSTLQNLVEQVKKLRDELHEKALRILSELESVH